MSNMTNVDFNIGVIGQLICETKVRLSFSHLAFGRSLVNVMYSQSLPNKVPRSLGDIGFVPAAGRFLELIDNP